MQANKSVALRAIESNVKAKRPDMWQMFSFLDRFWDLQKLVNRIRNGTFLREPTTAVFVLLCCRRKAFQNVSEEHPNCGVRSAAKLFQSFTLRHEAPHMPGKRFACCMPQKS